MTVDPMAAELLRSLPLLSALSPADARAADVRRVQEWTAWAVGPPVTVVPAVLGGVPVEVVEPVGGGPDLPTVVWCHGGGWVVGSPSTYRLPVARLAAGCQARVVSVDYRLAPEHPFPAGLDDCWAVVSALPGPAAVAGDSGGGNLAAALTLRALSEGVPLSAQLLVYPSVSLVRGWPSWTEFAADGGLPMADSDWFCLSYVPEGVDPSDPLVSPYEAPSLAGLPPAVVLVAEADPLRDGGLAYAERLAVDGVDVITLVAEGQVHGFLHMPSVPRAVVAEDAAHAAFRVLLHPG